MADIIVIRTAGLYLQFRQFEIQGECNRMGLTGFEYGSVDFLDHLYGPEFQLNKNKGAGLMTALFCTLIFRFDITVII